MFRIKFLYSIATILLFLAQSSWAASEKIGIVVFDGFLTSDVTAPVEVFGAASKEAWFSDYEVILISATKNKTITAEEGLTVVADQTIYDELDLDVLIVPSAYKMGPFINNSNLIGFIRNQAKAAKWMASNCSGAFLLAEAGVLDGKKATTWAGGEKELQRDYPKVKVQFDTNYVVDDGVITSNGGPVSYQAAFALLENLSSKKYATKIAEKIQYNRLESAFTP
ncbi:DJ-1/PfpI family protein [Microbulbifer taiwanensis]|uniref:DJ-1/PfpI family protein n=1 Tax=Microbulbifer taiwanensis TaxID=986746 RepID=A0ABW1YGK5_9GAMM|nr:DJ-1/PfpI family protein [Microbulbifer taiwanensis]